MNDVYVFSIPKLDQNVTRIKFVATCISGQIDLQSSRNETSASNDDFERWGWEGFIEYALENETNFSGNFYLGVYGISDSFYSLTVFVERNNASSSSQVYLKYDIP